MLTPVILTVQLLLVAMGVETSGTCPSAREILDHQARLDRQLTEESPTWRAHIEELPSGDLRVQVEDAHGERRIERLVPATGSCRARAESLAVLLAVWESDLEAIPLPPSLSRPEPALLPLASAAMPLPAVSDDPAGGRLRPLTTLGTSSEALPIPPRRLSLSFATTLGGTTQRGGLFPALGLGATLRAEGVPVGVQLEAWLSGARGYALGPGVLSVREELLTANLVLTREQGPWRGDLALGGAVAWMHLRARGFTQSASAHGFRPGVSTGLWLSRRFKGTWLGPGLLGRGWFHRPRLHVQGVEPVLKLRAFEATFGLRMGWELG